jgi:uroporphyrin-III C-methyltransferase
MTVYLVGAGPGDADLLTVRAARLLASAEVVVHDRLIDPSVWELVSPHTERIDVGKIPGGSSSQEMINALLVSLGQRYEKVVRLKGGDPFIFGRGGEEALALRAADISVEVIPGISSAFSAPLAAGIPVTHRGLAQGVVVVTGHVRPGASFQLAAVAHPDFTLVILMGVAERAAIQAELLSAGLAPATPVAIIERAWTSSQRVQRVTLDSLDRVEVENPATIVIGAVAALSVAEVMGELQVAGVA